MPATSTRATTLLDSLEVGYELLSYAVDESVGEGYGPAVAKAIGLDPGQVFKTIVAEADGDGVVAMLSVSERVSLKALARAVGAKKCSLVSPDVAERWTGYVVGGVSPFGQRRKLPCVVDAAILGYDRVAVSGGRRGLQLLVQSNDLIEVTVAATADIKA